MSDSSSKVTDLSTGVLIICILTETERLPAGVPAVVQLTTAQGDECRQVIGASEDVDDPH